MEQLGVSVETIPIARLAGVVRMGRAAWDRRPIQALPAASRRARSRVGDLSAGVDVVHAQLVRTGPLIEDLGVPVVVDLVDALSMNLERRSTHDRGWRRMASAVEARRLLPYERVLAGRAVAVAVSSADDAAAIAVDGIEVIPNGVDLEAFAYRPHPRPDPVVVFAGNLGYFPNVHAAVILAERIMPAIRDRVPGARLVLAGARPARAVRQLAGDLVSVVADPHDLGALVGSAAVTVVPMRAGSGIQNKVLEAMAAGTPVVTTGRVASAVGALDGEQVVIGEEPDELASAAAALLLDAGRAGRIAGAARRLVEHRFRWETSADAIEALWLRAGSR